MAQSVAAGPERACWSAIFSSLQACISEPIRFIHYGTLHVVRRLLFNRGMVSVRGTREETVNLAHEETGDKKSLAGDDDYSEQLVEYDHNSDDDELSNGGDYHDTDGDDYDDGCDDYRKGNPPGFSIAYQGDSLNLAMAYGISRDLVELLSVRPRFPFVESSFLAFNDFSHYYCSSRNGQFHRNVDSQGNLIIKAEGVALEDYFRIRIEIPEDDNRTDLAKFVYFVDPYACNSVITYTMPTKYDRAIDVTFLPMYRAIQATLGVNIDLTSSGSGSSSINTICYAYGEITAHHQFYGNYNVLLFRCGEDDKAEVIDGRLPLLRTWAAVPIYLEPLLIIKLNLNVCINSGHVNNGHTIFKGHLIFNHDQYEKTICNSDHGKVEVHIGYR